MVTYPLEVTRRRMMMGAPHANVAAALAAIVRSEGVAALFNGVLLSLVKQGPQMAITMSTYEVRTLAHACMFARCLRLPATSRGVLAVARCGATAECCRLSAPARCGAGLPSPPPFYPDLLTAALSPDAMSTDLQMTKQFLEL